MIVKILFDCVSTIALIIGFSLFGAKIRVNVKKYGIVFLFVTAQMLLLRYVLIAWVGLYAGIILYLCAIITYAMVFNESIIRSTMVFIIALLPIIVIETLLVSLLNIVGINTENAQQLEWPRVISSIVEIAALIVIKRRVPIKAIIQPIERYFAIFAFVFSNLFLFLMMMKITIDIELIGRRHNSHFLLLIIIIAAAANVTLFLSFFSENQKAKRLEKYNELKQAVGPLIENNIRIHHDFKNHLNIIKTYIGENNNAGQKLIKEINEKTKSESEYLKWMNPIFGALIQRKSGEAKQKEIDFSAAPHGLDRMFPIEDYQMASIIMNLLDNAFEATLLLPAKERSVRLEMGMSEGIYISVINSGVISTDVVSKMFSKGFSTKGAGRGTGLYSVKNLVNQNNGEIEVTPSGNTIEIKITFASVASAVGI